MSINSKMTAIADAIRSKTGETDVLTLDDMADAINELEIGVELPTLTNEGSASDLLSGKQLIDQEGNIVTGTITTKAATTYTPSTANQTIAAGTYCSGVQTIKGDANLVADNIKSGVSIFGVSGTLESGGGDSEIDNFITRNIASCTNSRITIVGSYAFTSCRNLTSVNFPVCTSIGSSAF